MASARQPKKGCRSAPRDSRSILDVWSCGQYLCAYYDQPVCLCCVNRGRDWPASALFGRGRAVSSGRRRCMGKMIQAH